MASWLKPVSGLQLSSHTHQRSVLGGSWIVTGSSNAMIQYSLNARASKHPRISVHARTMVSRTNGVYKLSSQSMPAVCHQDSPINKSAKLLSIPRSSGAPCLPSGSCCRPNSAFLSASAHQLLVPRPFKGAANTKTYRSSKTVSSSLADPVSGQHGGWPSTFSQRWRPAPHTRLGSRGRPATIPQWTGLILGRETRRAGRA